MKHILLRSLLVVLGVYDVYIAILGLFFRENAMVYAQDFFNFNLNLDTTSYWIVGLLSAYLLAFGAFLFVAASDPERYKGVIYVIIGLFVFRIFQRLNYIINVDPMLVADVSKKWVHLISIVVSALALCVLTLKMNLPKQKSK